MEAQVTMRGVIDMQVCVPDDWTDWQIEQFAERENPSGVNGWNVRTNPEWLAGAPVRNPCNSRGGFVHVMLDC